MIDFEMLRSLVSAHSPSGNEKQIASLIANYCAPYADEITTDAMGNLFVHKKGNGKKIKDNCIYRKNYQGLLYIFLYTV